MLLQRMIRAARLDVALYEEVEADPSPDRARPRPSWRSWPCARAWAVRSPWGWLGPAAAQLLPGASLGPRRPRSSAGWCGRTQRTGSGRACSPGRQPPASCSGRSSSPRRPRSSDSSPSSRLRGLAVVLGVWVAGGGASWPSGKGLDVTTGKALVTALVGWLIWWVVQVGLILAFGLRAMTLPF